MASQPLLDVWNTAINSPYEPAIGKGSHFLVGFSLLSFAIILAGYFSLNPSLTNVPVVGIPASLAFGFGAVYMICAVGVYV
ncbi:hypothetical protein BDZ85DRAFT_263761 [Elsinoe ampelina]|uniref:Dolichyl-diphosphooligosaccharide-protein glycosyltransferase subunit OST5 n=1 Tax=Elsinoe ampelina TaxID=302913 RepID=A0A6A6GA79_9PEZI|nr:hypothetical protein BDZ85DRAFT_263761 [Elsinoe ampelina]